MNAERKKKEESVSYFSGEKKGNVDSDYVEKPGAWYFPPVASLITAGGRLLLAMLEKSVEERDGGYLFCDTDSLCIVGSKKGGFVECPGGPVTRNNKSGINALSLSEVQEIAKNFRKLNPYDPALVPEILKIEDVNFLDFNPKKPFRQLFGYAISAKRYALLLTHGKRHPHRKSQQARTRLLVCPEGKKNERGRRRKWNSLQGVNLIDGESYQIAMKPTLNQDKVIPDSFRILLRKYLGKPETKSLAPDGTPCTGTTRGLLQRARITAGKLVPVGKETDRRWEQGDDPSMVDSDIYIYEKRTKLVIADPSERRTSPTTKDRLCLANSDPSRPVPILFSAPVVIVPLQRYCGLGSKKHELRNATPTLSVPAAFIKY